MSQHGPFIPLLQLRGGCLVFSGVTLQKLDGVLDHFPILILLNLISSVPEGQFLLAMRESLDLLPNQTPCISISFPAVSSASVWFLGLSLRNYDAAFVVAFLCPVNNFEPGARLWLGRTIGEILSCRCFWNFVLSLSVGLSVKKFYCQYPHHYFTSQFSVIEDRLNMVEYFVSGIVLVFVCLFPAELWMWACDLNVGRDFWSEALGLAYVTFSII